MFQVFFCVISPYFLGPFSVIQASFSSVVALLCENQKKLKSGMGDCLGLGFKVGFVSFFILPFHVP